MKEQDGFASGFFAGAIFGSVVGGILGALVASRRNPELALEEEEQINTNAIEPKKGSTTKRRQMQPAGSESTEMEMARRSLEDKIAQLNATIDEVRQQLGNVNGNPSLEIHERSSLRE